MPLFTKGPTCYTVKQKTEGPHPDAFVKPDVFWTSSFSFRLAAVDDGSHEVGAEHVVGHEGGPAEEVCDEKSL